MTIAAGEVGGPPERAKRNQQVKSLSKNLGVTLAEILIALSLMALSLLALVGLQATVLKGRQKSTVHVHASKLATSIMLGIENELKSDIETAVSQSRTEVPLEILAENPYKFEYEVRESFDGPPEQGLKDVAVTVYWKDKNGEQERTIWSKFIEQ